MVTLDYDDDIGPLVWYDLWTGRVSRRSGATATDRDFAVIIFSDDKAVPLDCPRIAYDDEWRVNRLLSVLAYASACWDMNRYLLLVKENGRDQPDTATFGKLWGEIASESESLVDRIVYIRDQKGGLQVCWRNDVPGSEIRRMIDAAWASRLGDGGYPYYCPDMDGVEHVALGKAAPAPRGKGNSDERRYTIDQLRGAWGAGYHQGQKQTNGVAP